MIFVDIGFEDTTQVYACKILLQDVKHALGILISGADCQIIQISPQMELFSTETPSSAAGLWQHMICLAHGAMMVAAKTRGNMGLLVEILPVRWFSGVDITAVATHEA